MSTHILDAQLALVITWQALKDHLDQPGEGAVQVLHDGRTATVHKIIVPPGRDQGRVSLDVDFGWCHTVAVRPWDHVAVLR